MGNPRASEGRMNGPRCFVAMRFGDAEIDAVCVRLLKPIIEEVATPRVVNRVVHNDRIDTRIRKDLRATEICLRLSHELLFASGNALLEGALKQRLQRLFTMLPISRPRAEFL